MHMVWIGYGEVGSGITGKGQRWIAYRITDLDGSQLERRMAFHGFWGLETGIGKWDGILVIYRQDTDTSTKS